MESIIVKHTFNYVREHNTITEHQSGFQPIDSTVNQQLNVCLTIILSIILHITQVRDIGRKLETSDVQPLFL
jgi:hypothetical protein